MRSLVFALSLLASIPFSVLAQDEPVGVRAEARILRPGVMPLRAIQGDMVLEIEGIPQPIEVLSWSWGVSQTGSGRAGAGGGAGRAQFKDLLENAVSDLPGGGRFAQISGFRYTYDPDAADGSRVVDVTLDDGTQIVIGGVVQDGADLVVATIDFLARGGDEYPFGDAPFTTLGVTYQQALFDYIEVGLGGLITATDYPEGGEGRITAL